MEVNSVCKNTVHTQDKDKVEYVCKNTVNTLDLRVAKKKNQTMKKKCQWLRERDLHVLRWPECSWKEINIKNVSWSFRKQFDGQK